MKPVLLLISTASIVLSAATIASAADSGPVKACLVRAQAERAAAIATGTPRAVADRIWAAAVAKCKARASVSSSVYLAFKPATQTAEPIDKTKGPKVVRKSIAEVPEGCRRVPGTDIFECPDRPQSPPKVAQTIDRHVPGGRRGAPKGTAGGGTRMSVAHYFG